MQQCKYILISFLIAAGLYACKSSPENYAVKWTEEIKEKIIEDANLSPDSLLIDSTRRTLTLYKRNIKLKQFLFKSNWDITSGNIVFTDTLGSIFYSTDQKFELVRELCPAVDRSFEGIKYKGNHIGLATFSYCNGQIKQRGFRFNGDVGIWKEYNTEGGIINKKDYENADRLNKLKEIKYSR